jgi:two-component system, chemotaxis family, chemotaxis protein CheY
MTKKAGKLKIMVVDGFSTQRRIVKTLLRQNGYKDFIEADNCENAYALLESNLDTNFIVVDWSIEDGNGLEFINKVRSIPNFEFTPFLIVTGEANEEEAADAIGSIPRGQIIVKPFTGSSLKNKMVISMDQPKIKKLKKIS